MHARVMRHAPYLHTTVQVVVTKLYKALGMYIAKEHVICT